MYILYIITIVAIMALILTIIVCRRFVQKNYNAINLILESILLKDTNLSTQALDDNRVSKLTHKARRIVNMFVLEVTKTTEEKEKIQSFISDMSHQMKTPLAAISMYTDLLLEESLSVEEKQEFLCRVQNSTQKLQWLMDNLIKMSRLEIGAIELSPSIINIKPTLLDAINIVQPMASNKNINIVIEDLQDENLYHDKKWTTEAVVNVLENAIKYSSSNNEIKIVVEPQLLYTKISITNYGVGIKREEFNSIFKRFYRGENVQEQEGSGLGLYLTTLIMEKQSGYIMVDSILGDYTSFFLFLQNCKK